MNAANSRFFIALLPSQAIQDYANEVKQVFVDRYNSRAALKSPPHITLQPPFEWLNEAYPMLNQALREFAARRAPLPITLSGFGAFVPRVIYINISKTPSLLALQLALATYLQQTLNIGDVLSNPHPFTPHMTVGFRDLTSQNFELAWSEFQHRPLQLEFVAASLTLLRHDGQQWNVSDELPFLGNQ